MRSTDGYANPGVAVDDEVITPSKPNVLGAMERALAKAEEAGIPDRNLDATEVALLAAMVVGEILQEAIDLLRKETA